MARHPILKSSKKFIFQWVFRWTWGSINTNPTRSYHQASIQQMLPIRIRLWRSSSSFSEPELPDAGEAQAVGIELMHRCCRFWSILLGSFFFILAAECLSICHTRGKCHCRLICVVRSWGFTQHHTQMQAAFNWRTIKSLWAPFTFFGWLTLLGFHCLGLLTRISWGNCISLCLGLRLCLRPRIRRCTGSLDVPKLDWENRVVLNS